MVVASVVLSGCPSSDAPPGEDGADTETTGEVTTTGMPTTTTGMDGTSTGMASTGVDSTGAQTDGSSTEDGSTGAGTGTGTGTGMGTDTGTGTDTDTGTGSSGSTGSELSQPCIDGCETEVLCTMDWASEEECYDACVANLEKAGAFAQACRAAWEDVHTCLGTLDCTDFAEWQAPTMTPYPCVSEDEALMFECKGQ